MEPASLSKKDKRFLSLAAGIALTSKCRFKHGCLIVKHGRILGWSPNVYKNDPRNVDNLHLEFCSVHSEIRAMKRAKFPRKAKVYVSRVNSKGEIRLSKPCLACQQVLDTYQCNVIWSV